MSRQAGAAVRKHLAKSATGIQGLDEITDGGLPRGRPTLVCGAAGCGKTLLAMQFLVEGTKRFNEPGVFVAFEETERELSENMASLGFDLPGLIRRKKLLVDYVRVERSEIQDTGEYDLEGLFVRLASTIDQIGARRIVLDTLESLFAGLPNEAILRAELRRLFRWLKDHGLTAVITAERGERALTRHGLEEYVSDCVILLDHRIANQVATRRLRVVKYRGSHHGTNEYPMLIDSRGISVLPISSLGLEYPVTSRRISTGIAALDDMLGGKGFYRGSSILISGSAGSGKTSVAASFAQSICQAGQRCLYFSFEESPAQITRNMASIGLDLERWCRDDRLRFHSVRPTLYGLEAHLASMHSLVTEFKPHVVIVDPMSNMMNVGAGDEVQSMLVRIIDYLKNLSITALYTSVTQAGSPVEQSETNVSSLIDTWVLLRMVESNGQRNRLVYVLKSRGMAHSNRVREFELTDDGIRFIEDAGAAGARDAMRARGLQDTKRNLQATSTMQENDNGRVNPEPGRAPVRRGAAALNRAGKQAHAGGVHR